MPRNVAKPLDSSDFITQAVMSARLRNVPTGFDVTVAYTKRDGTKSESTGQIAFFNGTEGMDTASVVIATADKGNRTINIHRIISIV